jgi:hypothetical protein
MLTTCSWQSLGNLMMCFLFGVLNCFFPKWGTGCCFEKMPISAQKSSLILMVNLWARVSCKPDVLRLFGYQIVFPNEGECWFEKIAVNASELLWSHSFFLDSCSPSQSGILVISGWLDTQRKMDKDNLVLVWNSLDVYCPWSLLALSLHIS